MTHDFVAADSGPTGGAECLIPVSIVTGFLGSGKTTLISRLLHDPEFGRTAIIVNEFGEVGLDHELIASTDDSVLTLNTGCLCCAVQTDLARTLMELLKRREAGSANYDRVLIETSGLSDPAPMLQAMMTDGDVSASHHIAAVVTLVDAVHGVETLHEHTEARQQVALADQVLISKTDLRAPSDRLLGRIDMLNPGAPRMATSEVNASILFDDTSIMALSERIASVSHRRGHSEIETFTIIRDRPIPALTLTMFLESISEHCGSRLLRLKGLVAIGEMPGRPAVIHGVRHVVNPPEFLGRWPSGDKRTRIVFIGRGLPRYFVPRLLEAIEEEVRDAIGAT
jgi:G3E family GTPase